MIAQIRHVEDCFDGSTVYDYELLVPVDAQVLAALSACGDIETITGLPRTLYRIRNSNGLYIQGIMGSCRLRAVYPKETADAQRRLLETLLRR